MTFDKTLPKVARLAIVCCLLSACGGETTHKSGSIKPEQRFDIARAAETSGNFGLARDMYIAAAAETEGDRTMQLRAAEGLLRIGAPGDAIPVLRDVLKRSPGDQDVRRALGKSQIMNGAPADGVDTLTVVLAARPDDDIARINKAVALDMLHRYAEAQPLYRVALARNPLDTEAANDLALSLMLSGQAAEAKAVLAPFRGRGDLPERLRTTIGLVDGAAGSAGTSSSPAASEVKHTAPTSLKPPSQARKAVNAHPVHAPDNQTPAR
jgi:Flp pilus assembly protein TadD